MPPVPIPTVHLLPELDEKLIHWLRHLTPADWDKHTRAGRWKVKDVAAHLLDGNIRTIALLRDGHRTAPARTIGTYHDLVGYLNELNADWVTAMQRVSPSLLVEWLAETGKVYTNLLAGLDPWQEAAYGVAWAGENSSANWFHVAREFTEKWHHQQQIREATGDDGALLDNRYFVPLMDTFLRALPFRYKEVSAEEGTVVRVEIEGIEKNWALQKSPDAWVLREAAGRTDAKVQLDKRAAWQLFTNGLSAEGARGQVRATGEERLIRVFLDTRSVMV
ncbi:MAG: maleylpyruvate isomerase N-terminal domain-containing protein [Cyclobacteriaceae bacterium]|jgi:uncharacterized protein (TIGR03083 family)|nr:maleylpyruvate isomerase N-terminal domain-containing protein [Cyclobacteriaceae bacterium]